MSLESYALQIAQKCRLAIAVSILNSKPNDLSIDQYLDQIRTTINDKTDDDLNISACSDDFNIDSDEFNIQSVTGDHNDENNDQSRVSDDKYAADDQNIMNRNKISNHNGSKHLDDDVEKNKTIGNDKTQDCNNHNDAEHIRKDKFRHLIKEPRDNNDCIKLHLNQACLPNKDFFEDVDKTQCYDKSHSTFDSTKVSNSEYMAHELSQNIFENSQNEQDVETSTKNSSISLQNDINIDKVAVKNKTNEEINEPRPKIAKKIHSVEDLKANVTKYANEINADSNKKAIIQDAQHSNADDYSLRERNTNHFNPANNITIPTDKPILNLGTYNNSLQTGHKIDNQNRQTIHTNVLRNTQNEYTVQDNNTYYSQSQVDDMKIDSRYIHGNKNIKATTTDDPKSDIIDETQHIGQSQSQNAYKQVYSQTLGDNYAFSQDAQYMDINTNIRNANEMESLNYIYIENTNEKDVALSKDASNMNKAMKQKDSNARDISKANFDKEDLNINKTNESFVFDKTKTNYIYFTYNKTAISDEACNSKNQVLDNSNITDEDEDMTTQEERIPFKIIEELNKVMMYLSTTKECSNDTGYRSGTQSKSSDTFSQSSNININEAAICLFNYIVSCDLVLASRDINDQISEVLSKLINRLHEEENYPTFIEELLETINSLLQHIYVGENYDEDVIVKKDEQIQRILLLTKSPHIQKYTIEKINSLLKNLLDEYTNDTIAEIKKISKMENLCYIFYLLQIILKKYAPTSIQSQNTQDEKVIRKKCISDLWRQKWIPNFKEENAGSLEIKCVLKECMEILNKIIVKFMDGYNLVAYSALNCFNLMQN